MYNSATKIYLVQESGSCAYGSLQLTKVYNWFEKNGYQLCDQVKVADLVVVGVCGLLEQNWLKQCRDISSYVAPKDVIIIGCLMNRQQDFLELLRQEFRQITCIDSKQLNNLEHLFTHEVKFSQVKANVIKSEFLKDRDRVFNFFNIIIATGCPFQCSFCTYPLVRGKVQSKPLDMVLAEFKYGLNQGYINFFLYADEFGSYGLDIDTSVDILLNEFVKQAAGQKYNLYIENYNPGQFIRQFELIKAMVIKGLIRFIDLPIQSGSQRILQLMGRRYDPDLVIAMVKELKSLSSELVITTDIIYAYPSETKEEFEQSLALTKYFDFITFHKIDIKVGLPVAQQAKKLEMNEIAIREQIVAQYEAHNSVNKDLRPYF